MTTTSHRSPRPSRLGLLCGLVLLLSGYGAIGSGAQGAEEVRSALTSGVIQVNCGGPAVGMFIADTNFSGGATRTRTNTIDLTGVINPAPEAVYQSQRYNNMSYSFSGFMSGSLHVVRLHFADTHWTTPKQRLFNVSINGTEVLENFDIVATAGAGNRALVESFALPASSSGVYQIAFVGVKDAATISGIEILGSASSMGLVVPHNGTRFHESSSYVYGNVSGYTPEHQHYFYNAAQSIPWNESGNVFAPSDMLYAWVFIPPGDAPLEVMLQFFGSDHTWNHRAFWGLDELAALSDGTQSSDFHVSGAVPSPGGWSRLAVTADRVGLTGMSVNGMSFTLYGGFAYWDDAGYLTNGGDSENVWVDDSPPNGAVLASDGGDEWAWLTQAAYVSSTVTGLSAQKSVNAAGEHQHTVSGVPSPGQMVVASSDWLYSWIYIDPIAQPSEIVLQWTNSAGVQGRAYWGANDISFGSGKTAYEGSIPSGAVGNWYRLKVSASSVGMAGTRINGLNFMLYNGAAYWDDTGRLAGGSGGQEYVWVDDGPPPGGTLTSDGGDHW
jgi:hypothetical protein